jgi:hypothetical protein
MGPYAGVDYNLTLCPLQSRLQHIYYVQPYARVHFIPQSRTLDLASECACIENKICQRGGTSVFTYYFKRFSTPEPSKITSLEPTCMNSNLTSLGSFFSLFNTFLCKPTGMEGRVEPKETTEKTVGLFQYNFF